MPSPNNQVETTLADLAVNLVFERTPGLADHYLGFELVPGSQNEEKTRAAGLLGFRVGNEELYIPVLFLNGKVKGTEVLYLKNADVFTSNSKQWVDYLTTKDTGVMGGGSTPRTPLQQPSAQGLSVFSRAPGSMGKMGAFFEGAAEDFWNKIASPGEGWTDFPKSENLTIKNVLRSLGKEAYLNFAQFLDDNPPLLAKMAEHFDLEKEIFIEDWPEEKVASKEEQEAELLQKVATFVLENKGPFFLTTENVELLCKEASLALDPEQKERCFTEGFIVLDKRAEDETTPVLKEDYRHRFESPTESGFYEIINASGSLEKVFIAHSPFMIEMPHKRMAGCLVLDPESGVYVLPVMGEQVFVRSRFSTEESVWKEKFGSMPAISSMEVGKSYMVISPSMSVSAPFRVDGKTKSDSGLSFQCSTPWDVRYRCIEPVGGYGVPCGISSNSDNSSLVIVDREDEARVVSIGNITYTPSSWKVIEVYTNSNDLRYDYGTFATDSEQQKKEKAEKEKMRKIYFRILPGTSKTISAVVANKGIHELTVHKSACDYTVRLDSEILHRGNKIAALEVMIAGLGLSEKTAREILDESVDEVGSKQWLMMKEAGSPFLGSGFGKTIGGALSGPISSALAAGINLTPGKTAPSLSPPSHDPNWNRIPTPRSQGGLGASRGDFLPGFIKPRSLGGKGRSAGDLMVPEPSPLPPGFVPPPGSKPATNVSQGQGINLGPPRIGYKNPNEDFLSVGPNPAGKDTLEVIANGNIPGNLMRPLPPSSFGANPPNSFGQPPPPFRPNIKSGEVESAHDAFERILSGKQAAGPSLNGEGLIYGGMAYPEEDPGVGTNEAGMNEVGPQVLREEVPLNSLSDPSQDWRNMDEANWDKIKNQDLQFLMRVAESGSKPVLETSVINLLLRSNRTSNQIAEWLPDFVNSLDSKCRLLLSFYWHNSDFSEDYGKDEMAEFEDVLLDSIKIDGQLILFLKQRAGESSSSKIDAFAG